MKKLVWVFLLCIMQCFACHDQTLKQRATLAPEASSSRYNLSHAHNKQKKEKACCVESCPKSITRYCPIDRCMRVAGGTACFLTAIAICHYYLEGNIVAYSHQCSRSRTSDACVFSSCCSKCICPLFWSGLATVSAVACCDGCYCKIACSESEDDQSMSRD